MAPNAAFERNPPRDSARFDVGRYVPERHRQRVAPAVFGFGVPLSHPIAWNVAIIAGRRMRVLALAPIIEGFAHHVAIRARGRVIAQVGCPLRKMKGIECGTDRNREQGDRQQNNRGRNFNTLSRASSSVTATHVTIYQSYQHSLATNRMARLQAIL